MKKQLLTMALAVLTIGAMAQEKVRVHNGNSNYVTTIEQITFDVTDADQAISVTDLEAENDSLATANETLAGEKTALATKNDSLATANATLAGEKASLETEKTALANEKTALSAKNDSLATSNAKLAGEKTALATKNDSLATANATLAGEKTTLANEKTALTAKNDSLSTSNVKLAGEKTALATKNDSLATSNAKLADEKASLTNEKTALSAKNDSLSTSNAKLADEKASLTNEKTALSAKNDSLATANATLTSEKDALKADTTELNAQVNTLKADTTSLKLGKQALEGQIVGLNSQVEGLETDTTTLKAEIQTLNGKIKQMQFAYAPEDCYVDLGLSVMWATCNVGANAPEEYGDYFAWGEIEGYNSGRKTSFIWSTYKWCNGSSATMTKYCTSNSYGIVDNKKQLDLADDAARANWGGKWRMPTQAEWEELCNNTNQEWTDDYNGTGVKGYVLTSTKQGYEGASIFLPAAGYRNEVGLDYEGSGYYWSSSLYEYNSNNTSRRMYFNSGHFNMSSSTDRCYGHSVRPVCPPAEDVLKAERQALESQIVGLNSQVEGLKTDTTTLNGQIKTLTGEKNALEADTTELNAQVNTLKADTTSLKLGKQALEGQIVGLNSQVEGLKTYTTSLKAEIQTLNDRIELLMFNGHDYVDLGLSVMWATCNVGANAPEEFGDYFAWGETEGYNTSKKSFSWSTYKLCNGSNSTLTKYCTSNSYGTVDNKTQLDLADDAARANWGGNWRMPTVEEWDELDKNTTKKWTQVNGKSGYLLTSKVNGNSLFLPAAGYCGNGDIYYDGSDGYYWSSSLYGLNSDYGRSLYFGSGNFHPWYNGNRYNGQSVRPVCPSAK